MGLFSGILGGIGGIVGGLFGGGGGSDMKKMSKKAFKQANPFGPYRKKYAEALGKIMDDPTSFLDNPLYEAAFSQGQQAVSRGMAAGGYLGSGNMATGLQQLGMSFAWGALQDQEKFLAHLAGADITPNFGPALSGYAQGVGMQQSGIGGIFGGLLDIGGSIFKELGL